MIEESDLETDVEAKSRKRKKFIHPRRNSKIARSFISATNNNSVTNTNPSTSKSPDTSSEFFENSPSKKSRNDFLQPSTSSYNPSVDQNLDFGFDLDDEPPILNQVNTSEIVEKVMPRTPDIVKTPKK